MLSVLSNVMLPTQESLLVLKYLTNMNMAWKQEPRLSGLRHACKECTHPHK